MGFPIGKVTHVATKILAGILASVPVIQAASEQFRSGTSDADKRDAVLALFRAELDAAKLITGRDLSRDGDIIAAAGAVNDTVWAFHKLLSKKSGVTP